MRGGRGRGTGKERMRECGNDKRGITAMRRKGTARCRARCANLHDTLLLTLERHRREGREGREEARGDAEVIGREGGREGEET